MTAGIVCDNYKLQRFEEELTKSGFKFKVFPFTKETSLINVETEPEGVKSISTICTTLELQFKRSN